MSSLVALGLQLLSWGEGFSVCGTRVVREAQPLLLAFGGVQILKSARRHPVGAAVSLMCAAILVVLLIVGVFWCWEVGRAFIGCTSLRKSRKRWTVVLG